MKSTNENLRLFKPFLRGLPIIIAVITISMMFAKRYLKYATPMYESTARIRLADPKEGSPSATLYKDFDVFTTANRIGSEVEMIKSKVIIGKTLDSLDFEVTTYRVGQVRKVELYHQSPFIVKYKFNSEKWMDKTYDMVIDKNEALHVTFPGELTPRTLQFDSTYSFEGGQIMIMKNQALLKARPDMPVADHYEFFIFTHQKLVDFVVGNLDITSLDKEIPILRLNYKSPVPQKAADFINMLSQTYVQDFIDSKYMAANTTVKFLNNQLDEVGGKLSASENAIQNYRDNKGIINIRQETETDLRKISDMKVQLTNVTMNLEAIRNLEQYMVKGRDNILDLAPNFEAYTDLLSTELIKKMKQLQAEKKDLLTKFTPEYEEVKNIDDKLKDISIYLEEGIRNTRKSLEAKQARLTSDIAESESVFVGLAEREKTMGILNRNFSLNEQTYNFLHSKRTEAQIARAATISFHRIITSGEVPKEPVTPNAGLLKVLSAFLGFLGSVALIYMVHAIKGKVNDSAAIEKNSSIPIAAYTPMVAAQPKLGEFFHTLAIQLEIKKLLNQNQVLAISSFSNMEGKSFNTLHLAIELVKQGKKVLVVDADGAMKMKQLVDASNGFDYINLVTEKGIVENSSTIKSALDNWRNSYDMVLIKNESVDSASDGLMLMKLADTNLFVFDSRRTPVKRVSEAELLQDEYKFDNIMFLLNRAGYNPSLFLQGWNVMKFVVNKVRKMTGRK